MKSSLGKGLYQDNPEAPTLLDLVDSKNNVDKIQSVRVAPFAVHGTMSFIDISFTTLHEGEW